MFVQPDSRVLFISLTLAAASAAPLAAAAQQPIAEPFVVDTTIITGSAITEGKHTARDNPADRAAPLLPVVYEEPAAKPAVSAPAPAQPAAVVQAAK